MQRNREMSFIESVFSFVFGDGDPNYNLEERRYRQVIGIGDRGRIVTLDVWWQGSMLEFSALEPSN